MGVEIDAVAERLDDRDNTGLKSFPRRGLKIKEKRSNGTAAKIAQELPRTSPTSTLIWPKNSTASSWLPARQKEPGREECGQPTVLAELSLAKASPRYSMPHPPLYGCGRWSG